MVDNFDKSSSRFSAVKGFLRKINQPRSLYAYLAVIVIAFAFVFGPMIMADYARYQLNAPSVQTDQITPQQATKKLDVEPLPIAKPMTLHQLVRGKKYKRFESMLSQDVDVNVPEEFDEEKEISDVNAGSTALILAAYQQYRGAVSTNNYITRLLRAGAQVDVVDKMGRAPLLGACLSGSGYHQLRKAGANPLLKLPDGNTVLSSCIAQAGKKSQLILENVALTEEELNRSLVKLVESCQQGMFAKDTATSVRLVLDKGANPNFINSLGEPVLVTAARNCEAAVVERLLKAGAFVSTPNSITGETAISASLYSYYKSTSSELAAYGGNINRADKKGLLPVIKMLKMNALSPDHVLYMKKDAPSELKVLRDNNNVIKSTNAETINRIKYSRLDKMLGSYGLDPNAESFDGATALIASIESNCVRCVVSLLKYGANPIAKNIVGESALDYAKKLPEDAAIYKLVSDSAEEFTLLNPRQKQALIFERLPKRMPELFLTRIENTETVIEAIDLGADVNLGDNLGRTPLSVACRKNNPDIFKILLERGANPNYANSYGITPLMYCAANQGKFLSDLLDAGANPNSVNALGESALTLAVSNCNNTIGSTENIGKLLIKGARVDAHSAEINMLSTIIERACSSKVIKLFMGAGLYLDEQAGEGEKLLTQAISKGHVNAIDMLVTVSAGARRLLNDGEIIHELFDRRKYSLVYSLLKNGADPHAVDANNESLLMKASKNYNAELVAFLLQSGVDVNTKGNDGSTALFYAAKNGDADNVKMMLQKGAEINVVDSTGRTPMSMAIGSKNIDTVKLLMDKATKYDDLYNLQSTYLIDAVGSGDYEIVRLFIDSGFDPNVSNAQRDSPLILAIVKSDYNIVRLLIKAGANVDSVDGSNLTALQHAVAKGDSGISRLLIESGAKFESYSQNQWPPLMMSINSKDLNLVRLLVQSGADVNTKYNKKSSLILAIEKYDIRIIEYLLSHGANVNEVDASGYTPIMVALNSRKDDVVTLLIKYGASVN